MIEIFGFIVCVLIIVFAISVLVTMPVAFYQIYRERGDMGALYIALGFGFVIYGGIIAIAIDVLWFGRFIK